MTAEKTPAKKSNTSDAQNEETVDRAVPPEVVRSGKIPGHDRDTIHMVAAVLLTIFWFGVVMISASLRPASPEVEKVLSWMFGGALLLTGIGGLIWRYVLRLGAALDVSQLQIDRLAVTDSMT
ncbi:MAG TPA: hypothetical protein VFH22_02775, partial [Rhodocyclaceae bacterium]|nr:hypothetical protein [Rhodocyclaceae bacterium]